jgi:hypothetical protein
MNGPNKPSKFTTFFSPSDVGSFGALAVAFASVSAVLYVIATAFTGGGMA